ncbi:MAG: nitrate- and nitrite sensing domain-containing protein [Natronospirillum sp.]|uniref:nitrate- and nitrite sensing domain-containing protein n=1 Tax=Natronospirillum sp. TaxID=2812955 RepID=UPI0025F21AD9|nr:nitrate- and nitrite sensing domain-containing protein [Natronospirillum sp.]MCH8552582.1 nitrate- and nitrite sensing domain-containing protein [Natronospirillum sp.]
MASSIHCSDDVTDYLMAALRCDLLSLQQLLTMGQLIAHISELVHRLQYERGTSNLYVGSQGVRCKNRLPALVKASQQAEEDTRRLLGQLDLRSHCISGASRLLSRIALALHGLDELQQVRSDILSLKSAPASVFEGFSSLIQSLLAIVFEAADTVTHEDLSNRIIALFHLMQGKELCGQERALGAAGLAMGQLDEDFTQQLQFLIDNQERCFSIVDEFSDAQARAHWTERMTKDQTAELERMRRIAFTAAINGEADRDLSDTWFAVTSERISVLRSLEQGMEARLQVECETRIAEAKERLDDHEVDLARAAGHRSVAFFFLPEGSKHHKAKTMDIGCVGQHIGRSLFELLQDQSLRLQQMAEELQEAKIALNERKLIDKAKGVIMSYRGLSEPEAHRFLRQVAMSQNRRLVDVARETLSMAEVFPAPKPKS